MIITLQLLHWLFQGSNEISGNIFKSIKLKGLYNCKGLLLFEVARVRNVLLINFSLNVLLQGNSMIYKERIPVY